MLFHITKRKAIETQQHSQARGEYSEDNSFIDLSQVSKLMSANAKVLALYSTGKTFGRGSHFVDFVKRRA